MENNNINQKQATLLWIQAGACGGDSMSLLNLESPDFLEMLEYYSIKLLWHPSLSLEELKEEREKDTNTQDSPNTVTKKLNIIVDEIINNNQELTFLCVEGAILESMYDPFLTKDETYKAKKDIVKSLCDKAKFVLAMGTCACYGGIAAAPPNPTRATGLQWLGDNNRTGLLEQDWKSKGSFPVINIAGCPAHPHTMIQTMIVLLLDSSSLELDGLNRPKIFYNTMVHQGCTRNEYHEYDMEDQFFGDKGCLFFNLGCQGPRTKSTCNTILWNNQKSKTRAGVPCFGCTSPSFPMDKDLFKTDKIDEIPVDLPLGIKRPFHTSYKKLAKKAAAKRLIDREMDP